MHEIKKGKLTSKSTKQESKDEVDEVVLKMVHDKIDKYSHVTQSSDANPEGDGLYNHNDELGSFDKRTSIIN